MAKKKHTFSDEKKAIQSELDNRGDLSTKEKEALIKRIEAYSKACKKLNGEEEKRSCCGHEIAIGYNEFTYELKKLREEVTPFSKFKEKIKKRLSEIEDDEDEY